MSAVDTVPLHLVTTAAPVDRSPRIRSASAPQTGTLRSGTAADGHAIHALILEHRQEGHLLPRDLREVTLRADRFIVVTSGAETDGDFREASEFTVTREGAEFRVLRRGELWWTSQGGPCGASAGAARDSRRRRSQRTACKG